MIKSVTNQNGFTYILALTIVMIMGIMLGMVGQSWKTLKQREQEKELLFRGSQIKEAIENWYDSKYKPDQMPHNRIVRPLTDLKDLLKDPNMQNTPAAFRYLPQTYAIKLDDGNPNCAPDCPKLKIYQDPMTGKEWNIIKCDVSSASSEYCMKFPGTNTIIGVSSKSDETPFRSLKSFKDTALENLGTIAPPSNKNTLPPVFGGGGEAVSPKTGGELTKYSEWKFIADSKNDHSKIYRAYHEVW